MSRFLGWECGDYVPQMFADTLCCSASSAVGATATLEFTDISIHIPMNSWLDTKSYMITGVTLYFRATMPLQATVRVHAAGDACHDARSA